MEIAWELDIDFEIENSENQDISSGFDNESDVDDDDRFYDFFDKQL